MFGLINHFIAATHFGIINIPSSTPIKEERKTQQSRIGEREINDQDYFPKIGEYVYVGQDLLLLYILVNSLSLSL